MAKFAVQKPRKEFLSDNAISAMGDNLWITRKYRGFTGIAQIVNGNTYITSGNSVTTFELPHLNFKEDGVYVGEIYTPEVEDENFLQMALNNKAYEKIHFAIYDVLGFRGEDLSKETLGNRKAYLDVNTNAFIHAVEESAGRDKESLLDEITKKGWEGVVAADLRALHTLNTGANGKRQRGMAWKLKPSLHLDLLVTGIDGNVINAINPLKPNGEIYRLGSFRDTLDPKTINIGDLVEVKFCSIDRDGNLVHPVVTTIKSAGL